MIKAVLACTMVTFAIQLIVMLFTLIWGVHIVLPEIVHHGFSLYLALPTLVDIVTLSGDALGAYYVLLVLAILASAAWLFLKSWKGFVLEAAMRGKSREHSPLFDMCGLMFAVLFLNVVVVLLMGATGWAPTDPVSDSELWELLFLLANASVWEELVTRVLLIGIPLLVIDLLRRKHGDGMANYFLGGGFKFGAVEVALILISSVIFGFAHYEGWGSWKVFPATVAGLAFGYMFMKHGLASAIMLHFSFDYLSMPMQVFEDSMGLTIVTGLAVLLWVGLGFVFFVYFTMRMVEFVTGLKLAEEKPQLVGAPAVFYPQQAYYGGGYSQAPPVPIHPAQQPVTAQNGATPGFGGIYACPYCGYTEARWINGRFQCLRCGRLT